MPKPTAVLLNLLCATPLALSLTASVAAAQAIGSRVVDYTTGAYRVADGTVMQDVEDAMGAGEGLGVGWLSPMAEQQAFLKFVLPVTAAPITEATLHLHGMGGAIEGVPVVDVYAAESASWTDDSLVWRTRPALLRPRLGQLQSQGAFIRLYTTDATRYVRSIAGNVASDGGDVISFGLIPIDLDPEMNLRIDMYFQSKEGEQENPDRGIHTMPAVKLRTRATPQQFFEQHCESCHGDPSSVSGSAEDGLQSLCYVRLAANGDATPLDFDSIQGYVTGMMDAANASPTGDRLPQRDGHSKGGATTGCYIEEGDCVDMNYPLARYVFSELCQFDEPSN